MKAERNFPRFIITAKGTKWVEQGHPWIYAAEVVRIEGDWENGGLADAVSEKGKYLGTGFISQESKIRLRLISHNANDRFDEAFWFRRIRYAWDYRKTVMGSDISCCRVIFGEADGFPGLTVDRFSEILVTQTLSVGMVHISHKAEVHHFLCAVVQGNHLRLTPVASDNVHVGTGQTYGVHTSGLQGGNDTLVHQTSVHHGHHLEHILVGNAAASHHTAFYAQLRCYPGGRASSAMHQHLVARHGGELIDEFFQRCLVLHYGTANLYDVYLVHCLRLFQIGVTIQTGTVVTDELLAFALRYLSVLHGLADPYLQAADQFLRFVLHVFQHICHGFTVDYLLYLVTAIPVYGNVHGIGVAEEIVHVAHNLLVCTDEEHAYVVVLSQLDGVQGQVTGLLGPVHIG